MTDFSRNLIFLKNTGVLTLMTIRAERPNMMTGVWGHGSLNMIILK